jgi:hypothetical protein
MPYDGLEVQSAQQLRELQQRLLQRELTQPFPPTAVGGPLCWLYDIGDALVLLRQTEIEAELGLKHARDPAAVKRAASEVLCAVDDYLRPFETCADPVPSHLSVWRTQALAKRALLDVVGNTRAVRACQADVTTAPPLTVCIGRTHRQACQVALGLPKLRPAKEVRKLVQAALSNGELHKIPGITYSHGDGCARAHFESTATERLFKHNCDTCASDSGNRQRAVEQRFMLSGGSGSASEMKRLCGCGNSFEPTRNNQTRCEDCRQQHRVRRQRRVSS